MKLTVLSGVLLLVLGQVVACPFRVEIISNEHGKTQVNVINEESTEEVQEEPETKNPIISQVDSSEKKTVHHADSGPQWLGLQFNARQRAKLAEMIVRDSRDYINEETMDVILRSIEAVSRMGSLTLGTSRPFVSTADESGEETKLPEPTVIETPATEAPSHTTTYPAFDDVRTTTTTTVRTTDYVWPPPVTTQGTNEQTKIIAWWNKMWYGKTPNGAN